MRHTVRMEVPSDHAYVDLIDAVFGKVMQLAGHDEDSRYWMSIAIREAADNAHKHGNKGDNSKRITFEAEYTGEGRVTAYVGDEGSEKMDVGTHLSLKDDLLRTNGRGIFFMGQFASEPPCVEYILKDGSTTPVYPANGAVTGKRIKLVKYRPQEVISSR